MDTAIFVLKVFLISLIGSISIKYLAPFLNIAPTSINALIGVIFPPLILAIVLLGRRNSSRSDSSQ